MSRHPPQPWQFSILNQAKSCPTIGVHFTSVLYILFCWTLVPTIVSIVECYYMVDRVHRYNDTVANDTVANDTVANDTVANDIVARMRRLRPPS